MQYNPKLNYQICKNIITGPMNENEHKLKSVFFLRMHPKTRLEKKILVYKKLIEILLNSTNIFHALLEIYYSINGKKLSENKQAFLAKILKYYDEDLMYQRLIESPHFKNKEVFLIFIYTAKRLEKKLYPIIFYHGTTKVMNNLFRLGEVENAISLLKRMKKQTERQNLKHKVINRKQVIDKIMRHQKVIKEMKVKELLLVGSCARDEMNEYSDIDLICLVNHEENELVTPNRIKEYFINLFSLHVDLKVGGELDDLDLNANFKRDIYKVF